MTTYQSLLLDPDIEDLSSKRTNFSLKIGFNNAYIFSNEPYNSEPFIPGNIPLMDIEKENNYTTQYLKATYSPDIKDLIYKRYNSYGQTSNLWQKFSSKLTSLKDAIGEQLFNQLRLDQQILMASTFGVVNDKSINPQYISREQRG